MGETEDKPGIMKCTHWWQVLRLWRVLFTVSNAYNGRSAVHPNFLSNLKSFHFCTERVVFGVHRAFLPLTTFRQHHRLLNQLDSWPGHPLDRFSVDFLFYHGLQIRPIRQSRVNRREALPTVGKRTFINPPRSPGHPRRSSDTPADVVLESRQRSIKGRPCYREPGSLALVILNSLGCKARARLT